MCPWGLFLLKDMVLDVIAENSHSISYGNFEIWKCKKNIKYDLKKSRPTTCWNRFSRAANVYHHLQNCSNVMHLFHFHFQFICVLLLLDVCVFLLKNLFSIPLRVSVLSSQISRLKYEEKFSKCIYFCWPVIRNNI